MSKLILRARSTGTLTKGLFMLFRKGAGIESTDGPFGSLSDVVVDPFGGTVTHVVVAPHGDLHQPRLVPVWLVCETGDGLRVELDGAHIRQLQRALQSDFVRAAADQFDGEATLRFKTVLHPPYFSDPTYLVAVAGNGASDSDSDSGSVEPESAESGVGIDDCEIRRTSVVISCNDRSLGSVEGFLVKTGRVHAVIVRSGLSGFRHDVAVPIESVAEVYPDMVTLHLDRHEFRLLPTTDIVPAGRRDVRPRDVLHDTANRVRYATVERVHNARSGW